MLCVPNTHARLVFTDSRWLLLNFTIKINVHPYLHKVTIQRLLNFTIKINVHPYLHKVTIQCLLCVSLSIE